MLLLESRAVQSLSPLFPPLCCLFCSNSSRAACLLPNPCLHLSCSSEPPFSGRPSGSYVDRLEHSSYHLKAAPCSTGKHFQTGEHLKYTVPHTRSSEIQRSTVHLSSPSLAILKSPVLPLRLWKHHPGPEQLSKD